MSAHGFHDPLHLDKNAKLSLRVLVKRLLQPWWVAMYGVAGRILKARRWSRQTAAPRREE